MPTKHVLSTRQRALLLALLLAAFALRTHQLVRQDIWWDEARNIDVALRAFFSIPTAPELDIHPPIYFLLLHLWSGLLQVARGTAVLPLAFVTRLLSVGAGTVGVALLYQLARSAGGVAAGLSAALIGGASAFWLAESQETRMYTVGFALLTGAALAFYHLLRWEEQCGGGKQADTDAPHAPARYRYHIAFVVLSALALLTHYNAVFILVAWYLWWGGWALFQPDRWRKLRTMLICGAAMTVLVLPVAPIALRQIPGYANPNLTVPSITDYLGQNWQAYWGGYAWNANLLGALSRVWLGSILGILLAGLGIALGKSNLPGAKRTIGFLLTWFAGGLALYYIAVVDRGAFNVRYSSFITPALFGLLGVAVSNLERIAKPLPLIALLLLLVGMAPAARADIYAARVAREDVSGLTEWLRTNTGPGDVIFVDQKYPFGFYYPHYTIGDDAWLGDSATTDSHTAPARYLFVDINTIDQELERWAGNAQRVFWVQWFESDTDPRRAVSFLLDKEGVRSGEQTFNGYSVDWWVLTPPTDFELAQSFLPVEFRWETGVKVSEIALPNAPIAPGDTAFVVMRWGRDSAAEPSQRPLKARVALVDGSGARIAQSDERILNDRHLLPAEWVLDDAPLNVYKVSTPSEAVPGIYTISLLVYDADTLEPVGYLDEANNPAGVELVIGQVVIE